MIGYELKTSAYDGKKTLMINLYVKDNYGWDLFGQITYTGTNSWSNFNYDMLAHSKTGFENFMKFGVKLVDHYYDEPEILLSFIANSRGVKRLINDSRLNVVSTIKEIEKSVNFEGFKIFVNGQYYQDVLAIDEQDAKKRIFAEWLKSNNRADRLIEDFVQNGEIVQRSFNSEIRIKSIDEILNMF